MQDIYKQHEDVAWYQDWWDVCHYFYFPTSKVLKQERDHLFQLFSKGNFNFLQVYCKFKLPIHMEIVPAKQAI